MKRLDGIAGAADAVLAKLDVEGFEEEVIKGGMNLLSSSSPLAIQCESHGPFMTSILNARGFDEYFYDPLSRSLPREPLGYKSSNALFVRDRDSVVSRLEGSQPRRVFESVI